MNKSLLFIPDISGYTEFVQTTEVEHSQHVITELLEILIDANTQQLQLAEVEGDALFFYKEQEIPSREKLLAQVETMFTAFYSHLKLLEKNRICPCNACATAPNLKLKIVAHCSELQFINVQNKRKPFGSEVIEAHRLMKNSVDSDNYVLLTKALVEAIHLPTDYQSMLFRFNEGSDVYDNKALNYVYAIIDAKELKLKPFETAKKVHFEEAPSISISKEFPVSSATLLEYITNYSYRHLWSKGVEKIEFDENQVTRIGSEHVCVVNGKHLNFITVSTDTEPGVLSYGEMTTSPPPVDELYQFFNMTSLGNDRCLLTTNIYLQAASPLKKLACFFLKPVFKKKNQKAIDDLHAFVTAQIT